MRTILERIEAGTLELSPLSIAYDDLHPLWGGLRLTVHGSGEVEQQAVRQAVGQPVRVAREDLLGLVRLLLHHQTWIQLVADRTLVPDESRVVLTMRYADEQTAIWEPHHQLIVNRRIVQIRDRMQQIAWRATTTLADSADRSSSMSRCGEDDIEDSKY